MLFAEMCRTLLSALGRDITKKVTATRGGKTLQFPCCASLLQEIILTQFGNGDRVFPTPKKKKSGRMTPWKITAMSSTWCEVSHGFRAGTATRLLAEAPMNLSAVMDIDGSIAEKTLNAKHRDHSRDLGGDE